MKKKILLLGDYIVDEFLEDLCEINSDYKVSHIYVLNTNPDHEKLIEDNNIEVIRGWHDYTSLIHEDFNADILLDSKFKRMLLIRSKVFLDFLILMIFFITKQFITN